MESQTTAALKSTHYFEIGLLISILLVFLWSGIAPTDRFTWYLEVAPAAMGIVAACLTYSKFPLSRVTYVLIWIHCVILLVGGHYTYEHVPPFDWLKAYFAQPRNYYDRLGHLAQGFIPAIIAREILVRVSPLKPGKLLNFLIICFALAFSAFYEIIEMSVSLYVHATSGGNVDAFLGTQGDVWDTQWDMSCALIGASVALLSLSRLHDRSLSILLGREMLTK